MTMSQSQTKPRPASVQPLEGFRRDEVEIAITMFQKSSTGADVQVLARSSAAVSLHRKFLALRERLRDGEGT